MATAYAVAASNWLKTTAASNLFGYMVVKEYWRGPGEGVTIFHPGADLSNQVFLKGDAEYCFAATLYAITYAKLYNVFAGPTDPQWPCIEANCAEFDLSLGKGLTYEQILRVWARRLALQIEIDRRGVFPWKIAALSAGDFQMLFYFRPWDFTTPVPGNDQLPASARREVVELPRVSGMYRNYTARITLAPKGCSASAPVKDVPRSSHMIWRFTDGKTSRYDFGQIWDSNPFVTFGVALWASTFLPSVQASPISHPHVLGIRCLTRLLHSLDPVHPETGVELENRSNLDSARRTACAIPGHRPLWVYPLRAFMTKFVAGCPQISFIFVSLLRACGIPAYAVCARFTAMSPADIGGSDLTPRSVFTAKIPVAAGTFSAILANVVSPWSKAGESLKWGAPAAVSDGSSGKVSGASPCGDPANHHGIFCTSAGIGLGHADTLLGPDGFRYLERSESVWFTGDEVAGTEFFFELMRLFHGSANGELAAESASQIIDSRCRTARREALLGFCSQALTMWPTYKSYIIQKYQAWAVAHVQAIVLKKNVDASYLSFFAAPTSSWKEWTPCGTSGVSIDVPSAPTTAPLDASFTSSGYVRLPSLYVTNGLGYNTLNKALRRPLPYDWYKKWCEAPDGLAFAETSPSREAYIGLKELLLSNDFICRQAIDKFAESVAYLPWN